MPRHVKHAHETARVPDFFLLGAMKSGTTTLFRWLGEHPSVFTPELKEPNFFSWDSVWKRGLSWYEQLFRGAEPGQLIGEASGYYSPEYGEVAAARIAEVLPAARFVFIARDPKERLRSHYRHAVLHGREQRPFGAAIRDEAGRPYPYVAYSEYHRCLEPFVERFGTEWICVVRSEDTLDGGKGWMQVLDHLGLPWIPAPSSAHNISTDKAAFTPLLGRLYRTALFKEHADRVPGPARRVARRLLLRSPGGHAEKLLESADAPLDPSTRARIEEDAFRLAEQFNLGEPYWFSA